MSGKEDLPLQERLSRDAIVDLALHQRRSEGSCVSRVVFDMCTPLAEKIKLAEQAEKLGYAPSDRSRDSMRYR